MKAFRRLPGVGPRTAQRFVFQLLARDRHGAAEIASTLQVAVDNVRHCRQCNNFSESEICNICSSHSRDHSQLCIVETPADLASFEDAGAYQGLYFVLMGRISPLDGIGPDDLGIEELLKNAQPTSNQGNHFGDEHHTGRRRNGRLSYGFARQTRVHSHSTGTRPTARRGTRIHGQGYFD